MDHPAIAKVFDAGSTVDGAPYFVMEYVAGVPINEYCDKHRLNTLERLDLFTQVCESRLFVNNGMASLEIQDRGKGLPPGVLEHGSHGGIGKFGVGLRGMSERLQHLGGRLEILSTDRGTTVVATVPSNQASK